MSVVRLLGLAAVVGAGCSLGGCASSGAEARHGSRPAPISHVVFIKLKNPADAAALIAESDRLLPAIPSVTSYACGRHFDMGRPNIDSSYDVGLYVGFADAAGYQTYVDHPNHVQLVTDWRPRWESIRIYDVGDQTP